MSDKKFILWKQSQISEIWTITNFWVLSLVDLEIFVEELVMREKKGREVEIESPVLSLQSWKMNNLEEILGNGKLSIC